jgi:GTPase
VMSAINVDDVAKLHDAIQAFFQKQMIEVSIVLPWSQQQLRAEIFGQCKVIDEQADEQGALLKILGPAAMVKDLQQRFGVVGSSGKS